MEGKEVGALVLCGVFITCVISLAQNQAGRPETGYLIQSLQGPALYRAYCAVCHGSDGKGHGPMAKSLKTKLPDLTRIRERNSGAFPLERIEKIISGEEQLTPGAWNTTNAHLGSDFFADSLGSGPGTGAHL